MQCAMRTAHTPPMCDKHERLPSERSMNCSRAPARIWLRPCPVTSSRAPRSRSTCTGCTAASLTPPSAALPPSASCLCSSRGSTSFRTPLARSPSPPSPERPARSSLACYKSYSNQGQSPSEPAARNESRVRDFLLCVLLVL